MTREEAVEIQYQKSLGRHNGMVLLLNRYPVELLNLNYPQHFIQMARVKGEAETFWVQLDILTGVS
jgi:hypothetical protein